MKKNGKYLLMGAGAVLLAAAVFFTVRAVALSLPKEKNKAADGTTLAAYSEYELFADVPLLTGANLRYENAKDDGGNTYGINVYDTTLEEYRAYLQVLEKSGFTKYTDNGENGVGGCVYKAYYRKGDLRVAVTHFTRLNRTMISAAEKGAWSEHLLYSDDYVADNVPGARTTMYQEELYNVGLSFVIRLKNGHFIINDGGWENDLPYLLDDLEKLTPEGEKPVIEAWFISHAHDDHMGVFKALFTNKEQLDRIYVENVYFNDMGADAAKFHDQFETASALLNYVRGVPAVMHSTDGGHPSIYELSVGDRYYFNDFNVEVVCSAEVLADYTTWGDQNGTSTWLMYNIEGQKVLISADGNFEDQQAVMAMYDRSYLNLTMFSTPHHGYDMFDQFTDCLDSLLYTNPLKWLAGSGIESGSSTHTPMLEHINEISQESYAFGAGTVVFEFPYEVGTATVLPEREWIYNVTPPSWKWD